MLVGEVFPIAISVITCQNIAMGRNGSAMNQRAHECGKKLRPISPASYTRGKSSLLGQGSDRARLWV